MEKQDKDILPEAEKEGHLIGRRKLLKMLVATVGAAEASFLLPEKWTKPLFDAIIVPAHAATSGPAPAPVISNFTIERRFATSNTEGALESSNGKYPPYLGQFEYSDPDCEVDARYTKLNYQVSWDGRLNFNSGATIKDIPGGSLNGTSCRGMINFPFITQNSTGAYIYVNSGPSLSIQLKVNGRLSNVLNQTVNPVTSK